MKKELRLIPQSIHYARAVKKKKNKRIISSIISMAICSLLHEMFNPRTLFCFVFKKKDKNSQRYSLNNQDKTKTVLVFFFSPAGEGKQWRKWKNSFKCHSHIRLIWKKLNPAEYTYSHPWSTKFQLRSLIEILQENSLPSVATEGLISILDVLFSAKA